MSLLVEWPSRTGAPDCPAIYSESKWLITFIKAKKQPLHSWAKVSSDCCPGNCSASLGKCAVLLFRLLRIWGMVATFFPGTSPGPKPLVLLEFLPKYWTFLTLKGYTPALDCRGPGEWMRREHLVLLTFGPSTPQIASFLSFEVFHRKLE